MKDSNLIKATMEELEVYRKITLDELSENNGRYTRRFPTFPAHYGSSINDDYNGEADDFLRLNQVLLKIDEEIGRRNKKYAVD